ncbi:MAG: hypothetical protein IT536_05850 [Hyphomicrobiales bacterium]|nr:hypothetical protein [Hyphomicrobiales bacterium]
MRTSEKNKPALRVTRRLWLGVPVVGGLGWLAGMSRASAQQAQKASLLAKAVEKAPSDSQDVAWRDADVLDVPLAPQAVVKPRLMQAAIKVVTVRALYDAERLALLLTWRDASRDVQIGGTGAFRDAVAIEFPGDPAAGIPYFAMGEPEKPVVIYQWKGDWQFTQERDEEGLYPGMAVDWYPYSSAAPGSIATVADYGDGGNRAFATSWHAGNPLGDRELQRRSPVEKLEAEGFGTLSSLPADRQDGRGTAAWKDGIWSLVLTIPRAQDRFRFQPGMTVPIAFAAWDGASRERGAEKGVSTWYFLSLEKPVGALAYISPLLAFVGAMAVQVWGLHRLRRRPGENATTEA